MPKTRQSPDRSPDPLPGRRRSSDSLPPPAAEDPPIRGKESHQAPSPWEALYGRLILQDGIAAIPLALFLYQDHLQLSAQQVWFAGSILAHKWDADLPYPKLTTLATESGVSIRTLQYLRASLCEMGYLQVREGYDPTGRRTANSYDFSGLFARLEAAIAGERGEDNGFAAEDSPEPAPEEHAPRSFVARYGRVIVQKGIAAVPRAIFAQQAALGLTPQQVWFVSYILGHRWTTQLPHPSLRRMARRTGYSEQHIHNLKEELVTLGYLHLVHRHGAGGGQDTNGYDFSGLLSAITARLHREDRSTPEQPSTPSVVPIVRPAARPRRGRREVHLTEKMVQPDLVAPVQLDLEDTMQPRIEHALQVASEGATPLRRIGANLWGGDPASGLRGGGASPLRSDGAAGLRRIKPDHLETKQETDSNQLTGGPEQRPNERPLYSPYIAQVVLDLSRELGDLNGVSNVTQALRLWQASGLGEEAFVQQVQTAKHALRKAQARGVANKGAYWMAVLRDQLGAAAAGQGPLPETPGDITG